MLPYKLVFEEVEEDYQLLAIHSLLEEYKLAFLLNKYLQISFKRAKLDLDFNHGKIQAVYPLYQFKDSVKYQAYFLIKNKYKGPVQRIISSGSLFAEEELSPQLTFFIPEYKEVDYFLKIEENLEADKVQEIISLIASIPGIITTYTVDPNQLKSKNNLILE